MASHEETKIGDYFIQSNTITPEQLTIALKRQSQSNDKLGSVLLQLGYITTEQLLLFLKECYHTPSIDLFNVSIESTVINSVPLDQMKRFKAVPIMFSPKLIFVAMSDPNNIEAINELEFSLGKKIQPLSTQGSVTRMSNRNTM